MRDPLEPLTFEQADLAHITEADLRRLILTCGDQLMRTLSPAWAEVTLALIRARREREAIFEALVAEVRDTT